MTKVAASTFVAGQTAQYTIVVSNGGPSVATAITISDVMQAGITFNALQPGASTLALSNASGFTATLASLAANTSVTITLTVNVGAGTTGNVTNTVVVSSTTPDPTPGNNTAQAVTPVGASADLSVTKVASVASGTQGQTFSYAISFTNAGPSAATGVLVTDTLGAGMTVVSAVASAGTITINPVAGATGVTATVASLAPSGVGQITLTVLVGPGTTALTNTAAITSPTPDPTPVGNTVTVVIARTTADISTSFANFPTASVPIGSSVTGSVTFGNLGPGPAVNPTVTLQLSPGLAATITNVVGAATVTYDQATGIATFGGVPPTLPLNGTISATIGFTQIAGGVAGTATANASNDTNALNNTATLSITATSLVDLSVTLVVPGTAAPGTTVTATVTVTNNGPSPASNVTATVVLPSGTSTIALTVPSLPANSSVSAIVTYAVPPAQSVPMNWTASVSTTTTETALGNNLTTGITNITVVTNASLSGRVWLDVNQNRVYDAGSDTPLPGYRVEVLKAGVVVGTATSTVSGQYLVTGLVPGPDYSVRFQDPNGNFVLGTPFSQATTTAGGNSSTGGPQLLTAVAPTAPIAPTSSISNITLYAGDNVIEQNLPLDPNGVIYNSVTRQPIEVPVTVRLVYTSGLTDQGPCPIPALRVPGTFYPQCHLVSGNDTEITVPNVGAYQFLFINNPPSGTYALEVTTPPGYASPPATNGGVAPPQGTLVVPPGVTEVQPIRVPPPPPVGTNGLPGTLYYFSFNWDFSAFREVRNNHIPLDPLGAGSILVSKTGNKTVAELGDSVQYTIRVRNTTAGTIAGVTVEDLLPAGFRYILNTARLGGAVTPNPAGGVGRALSFPIGPIAGGVTVELTYFVRLGVGSQQGDGINRASAVFIGAGGTPARSNVATFRVNVQGGVFTSEGCIAGKVFVDCDGNAVQNNDGGSREVGIPGVRLVLLDGSFVVTDNEGKYSICGIKPQTNVVKVDRSTLPKGSRLVPSSNRNAGVGDSLFVDLKGGELARADFIEGSCSPEVLDEVKKRRAQGGTVFPGGDSLLGKPAASGVAAPALSSTPLLSPATGGLAAPQPSRVPQ